MEGSLDRIHVNASLTKASLELEAYRLRFELEKSRLRQVYLSKHTPVFKSDNLSELVRCSVAETLYDHTRFPAAATAIDYL